MYIYQRVIKEITILRFFGSLRGKESLLFAATLIDMGLPRQLKFGDIQIFKFLTTSFKNFIISGIWIGIIKLRFVNALMGRPDGCILKDKHYMILRMIFP